MKKRKSMKELIEEENLLNEELERHANKKVEFMSINVMKASEANILASLNMLIYGAPGIGKTTFLGSAPKPFIIYFEGGIFPLNNENVDMIRASTYQDFIDGVKYAIDNKYKTLCIDSLTRYSDILMEEILKKENKEKPQIQNWGELLDRIKKMCWHLQKLEINTIFTCHESESDDEGITTKRPQLNGKLVQVVPGIMDVVGYMYVTPKKERLLSVNPTVRWYAKHRAPLENKIMEDLKPDFKLLLDKILGTKEEKNNG